MRRGLNWLLGSALGLNGLWMLIRPETWYRTIPGVAGTGPANLHFIRDIGCAYLVAGAGMFWLVKTPRQAWPAALAGGAFLTLHALVHLCDTAAGREPARQLLADLPAVVLPAFLVLWLVWLARRESKEG
jgi:uncharacterized protein YjeT (DUF2065 family)